MGILNDLYISPLGTVHKACYIGQKVGKISGGKIFNLKGEHVGSIDESKGEASFGIHGYCKIEGNKIDTGSGLFVDTLFPSNE